MSITHPEAQGKPGTPGSLEVRNSSPVTRAEDLSAQGTTALSTSTQPHAKLKCRDPVLTLSVSIDQGQVAGAVGPLLYPAVPFTIVTSSRCAFVPTASTHTPFTEELCPTLSVCMESRQWQAGYTPLAPWKPLTSECL